MPVMDESCAKDENENNMLMKKLSHVFKVQECDADEVELCTEVGFIKNKNKHNSPLLSPCLKFTEKITEKI